MGGPDAGEVNVVGALLASIGSLAAWIPARRAGSIDPIVSLRR